MPRLKTHWEITDDFTWRSLSEVIGQLRLAGKRFAIKIILDLRSRKQDGIAHVWYRDISDHLGDTTPLKVKAMSKFHCGVPILLGEDPEFAAKWHEIIVGRFNYDEIIQLMMPTHKLYIPLTSELTVPQMSEYLQRMQRYWAKAGVYLEFPGDYNPADYAVAA